MSAVAEISSSIKPESLKEIRKLLLSGDTEDYSIGMAWLIQLIGSRDATANYLVMLLCQSSEDDSDVVIDTDNYAKMKFTTYQTCFGKDYRYDIHFDCCFERETIVFDTRDYSRYQVGDGQPKFDFEVMICKELRNQGVKFYNELFLKL